jgi:hypothetical protein
VTVTIGQRRISAGPDRLEQPVGVRLRSRRTVVSVALRLNDGTRLSQALIYRRCG